MEMITYLRIIIILAIGVFAAGIYSRFIKKIIGILQYQDPVRDNKTRGIAARLQTILNEAILQRRIKERSHILWIRHLMIFGGCAVFFILEFLIGITKNLHSFDWLRPGLMAGLYLSGGIMLAGLLIALCHWIVYRKEESKLIDIKSLLVLFVVVLSGLMSASCRLLLDFENSLPVYPLVEFCANRIPGFFSIPCQGIHKWLFAIHITFAAGFFAWLPFSKLIHIVAAPLGRTVTQGKGYGAEKRADMSERLL